MQHLYYSYSEQNGYPNRAVEDWQPSECDVFVCLCVCWTVDLNVSILRTPCCFPPFCPFVWLIPTYPLFPFTFIYSANLMMSFLLFFVLPIHKHIFNLSAHSFFKSFPKFKDDTEPSLHSCCSLKSSPFSCTLSPASCHPSNHCLSFSVGPLPSHNLVLFCVFPVAHLECQPRSSTCPNEECWWLMTPRWGTLRQPPTERWVGISVRVMCQSFCQ